MPRLYLLGFLLCIFYAKARTQIYLRQLSVGLNAGKPATGIIFQDNTIQIIQQTI